MNVARSVRKGIRSSCPVGLVEFVQWRRRFEAISNPRAAGRLALSRAGRAWLADSLLEMLPPHFVGPSSICVDVGAYVGDWTRAVLGLVGPARVIAIEPSPAAYQQLESTLGHRTDVELHRCAVGDASGTADLQVMSRPNFNSLLPLDPSIVVSYPGLMPKGTVQVPMHPLDEVLHGSGRVKIIKIDVQGAEMEVLDGATEVLRRTDAVLLEVNLRRHYRGDHLFCELDDRMAQEGFQLHRLGNLYQGSEGLLWGDASYLRLSKDAQHG